MSKNTSKSESSSSWAYMTVWVVCAMAAIGYIAMLIEKNAATIMRTDVSQLKVAALKSKGALITGDEKSAKILAEINKNMLDTKRNLRQLNTKYYSLENRISETRRNLSTLNSANKSLNQKISLLSDSIGTVTGAITRKQGDQTLKTGTLKAIIEDPARRKPLPVKTKKPDARKQVAVPILKIKQIEKAIKNDPVAKSKIPVKAQVKTKEQVKSTPPQKIAALNIPAAKQMAKSKKSPEAQNRPQIIRTMFAVALGNYSDLDKLKNAWLKLSKKYQNALGTLKPRYLTLVVDNQPQYQLISGPLPNALDAAKICYHLQQLKAYCKQTVYHGSDI